MPGIAARIRKSDRPQSDDRSAVKKPEKALKKGSRTDAAGTNKQAKREPGIVNFRM